MPDRIKREWLIARDGRVMRRVSKELGGPGRWTVTEENPVAPDLETFRETYPDQHIINEGRESVRASGDVPVVDLQERIKELSDEQLAAMGLTRNEEEDRTAPVEDLRPKTTPDAAPPGGPQASVTRTPFEEDFPGRDALIEAGVHTVEDLRAYMEEGDLTDIDGIGNVTAGKITAALE